MFSEIQAWRTRFSYLVVLLILSSMIQIQVTSSSVVWTDNFNDQNIDDWFISRGVFSAENQTLWASGTENLISNRAYHECNVSIGFWSFDILLRYQWHWRYHPPQVRFMVNGTDDIAWSGYTLDFYTLYHFEDVILSVYLRVRDRTWKYLSHFDYDIPANGWQSIGIQRMANGKLTVLLNGSRIIETSDNCLENASYFVFDTEDCVQTLYDPLTHTESFASVRESPMLDNIQVIETSDPTFGNQVQLIMAISALFAGIAILVILKEEIKNRF